MQAGQKQQSTGVSFTAGKLGQPELYPTRPTLTARGSRAPPSWPVGHVETPTLNGSTQEAEQAQAATLDGLPLGL